MLPTELQNQLNMFIQDFKKGLFTNKKGPIAKIIYSDKNKLLVQHQYEKLVFKTLKEDDEVIYEGLSLYEAFHKMAM